MTEWRLHGDKLGIGWYEDGGVLRCRRVLEVFDPMIHVITGPPCAGKSTYVREPDSYGNLIANY